MKAPFKFSAVALAAIAATWVAFNLAAVVVDTILTTQKNAAAIARLDVAVHTKAPPGAARASRLTWPSLGQDKTIAIGEALKALGKDGSIIYCANSDCHDLMTDLDDAMQIADWNSDFERRPIDVQSEAGLFVGPKDNPLAAKVAGIIAEVTGYPVGLIEMDGAALGIVIGKRPR
jgi:hypothetical protein